MTNLERLCASIGRGRADRVMTYDLLDNAAILKKYGKWDDRRSYGFSELAEVNARALAGIGVDITRGMYDPVNHWMAGKIDSWIRFLGVDAAGWDVRQSGETAWIAKRPFHDLAGLARNMPRMPVEAEVEAWYGPFIEEVTAIYRQSGVVMIGGLEGPLCDAYTYTDMELFMLAMYDARELCEQLMDVTCEFSRIMADVFVRRSNVPVQFMGEDMAYKSGPIFDPAFLRGSVLPRWRKLMAPIRRAGGTFLLHTDGRYGALLPLIFDELGADALNPIERNGCNDIFEIFAAYPRKMYFGNVCCETTLPFGNVHDVEDEVLELLERIPGAGGTIFIGSSSEIHDRVPIENAEVLYRTVHEYGALPIDLDRVRRRRADIRPKLAFRRA
jgi:uroporphyrinogen-III decarboxylase